MLNEKNRQKNGKVPSTSKSMDYVDALTRERSRLIGRYGQLDSNHLCWSYEYEVSLLSLPLKGL